MDSTPTIDPTNQAVLNAVAASKWVSFALAILTIVAMWKLFKKAGKPGWAAIIPIYNIIVMLEIAGMPGWYVLLLLIPIVNVVIAILIILRFVKAYGKGTGFGILTIFFAPIMYAIMAFGDTKYVG